MELKRLLKQIVQNNDYHTRFLNTLSLQENIGARKISASEQPETTSFMVLKHAAEEHRHAFYLKKQIQKIAPDACPTYAPEYLLAPHRSKYYLNKLDLETARYLKTKLGLTGSALKYGCYLFVTYAIEVRADILYPIYQEVLDQYKSKVSVKNIIIEEQGHLEEMIAQLNLFSSEWEIHAQSITTIEQRLYDSWIQDLADAV